MNFWIGTVLNWALVSICFVLAGEVRFQDVDDQLHPGNVLYYQGRNVSVVTQRNSATMRKFKNSSYDGCRNLTFKFSLVLLIDHCETYVFKMIKSNNLMGNFRVGTTSNAVM